MLNKRNLRYFWPVVFLLLMLGSQSCLPPRCIKYPQFAQCRTRMMHKHDGMVFRGMPWYKRQHLQYGEKYKPQPGSDHNQTVAPSPQRREKRKRIVVKMK